MKRKPYYCFLLTATILVSCNPAPKTNSENPATSDTLAKPDNHQETIQMACYRSVVGKDTFSLQVKTFDNVASGDLSYLFHEKDSQRGSFDGRLMGDTLLGMYIFDSEGSTSSRQIAFLLRDNMALEGYGELEEKNGELFYKDLKTLKFDSGLRMNKIDCPH